MNYIPLHCHSMFSLLDGLSKPEQIAERCKEIGASACALTDHGNIAGAVKFYSAMKKNGIKPILGCELYICQQDPKIQEKDNRNLSHFIILAQNYQGWLDLIKIVSESNKPEHYYHKPRLDLETLAKLNSGNLIAIVGDSFLTLFDGGRQSNTTKSRLNAILTGNGNGTEKVFQKNHKWFISYDGITEPFESGALLG